MDDEGDEDEPRVLDSDEDSIYKACFSPDGKRVIGLSTGPSIAVIWNFSQPDKPWKTLAQGTGPIKDVQFLPDSTHFVLGHESQDDLSTEDSFAVSVWSIDNMKKPKHVLEGHDDSVTSVCCSRDGRFVASGGKDCMVKAWCIHDPSRNQEWEKEYIVVDEYDGKERKTSVEIKSVCFSPDSTLVAAVDHHEDCPTTAEVWNVITGKKTASLRQHIDDAQIVRFTPDGKWLVIGAGKGRLILWDFKNDSQHTVELKGHSGRVSGIEFSSSRGYMITSADQVIVWNRDMKLDRVVSGIPGDLSISPDGETLLGAIDSYTVEITTLDELLAKNQPIREEVKSSSLVRHASVRKDEEVKSSSLARHGSARKGEEVKRALPDPIAVDDAESDEEESVEVRQMIVNINSILVGFASPKDRGRLESAVVTELEMFMNYTPLHEPGPYIGMESYPGVCGVLLHVFADPDRRDPAVYKTRRDEAIAFLETVSNNEEYTRTLKNRAFDIINTYRSFEYAEQQEKRLAHVIKGIKFLKGLVEERYSSKQQPAEVKRPEPEQVDDAEPEEDESEVDESKYLTVEDIAEIEQLKSNLRRAKGSVSGRIDSIFHLLRTYWPSHFKPAKHTDDMKKMVRVFDELIDIFADPKYGDGNAYTARCRQIFSIKIKDSDCMDAAYLANSMLLSYTGTDHAKQSIPQIDDILASIRLIRRIISQRFLKEVKYASSSSLGESSTAREDVLEMDPEDVSMPPIPAVQAALVDLARGVEQPVLDVQMTPIEEKKPRPARAKPRKPRHRTKPGPKPLQAIALLGQEVLPATIADQKALPVTIADRKALPVTIPDQKALPTNATLNQLESLSALFGAVFDQMSRELDTAPTPAREAYAHLARVACAFRTVFLSVLHERHADPVQARALLSELLPLAVMVQQAFAIGMDNVNEAALLGVEQYDDRLSKAFQYLCSSLRFFVKHRNALSAQRGLFSEVYASVHRGVAIAAAVSIAPSGLLYPSDLSNMEIKYVDVMRRDLAKHPQAAAKLCLEIVDCLKIEMSRNDQVDAAKARNVCATWLSIADGPSLSDSDRVRKINDTINGLGRIKFTHRGLGQMLQALATSSLKEALKSHAALEQLRNFADLKETIRLIKNLIDVRIPPPVPHID